MRGEVAEIPWRGASDGTAQTARASVMLPATVVFLVGVLSRLPFRSQVLYHWDSVNFALATVQFDVTQGQPHAPGYILYVALGWLGNLVTHDPQSTFVYLSALCSGLSVAALFLFGTEMFDRRTGLVAALLLLSSPLFWFYGEIALPHTLDAFFVIVLAHILYRAWQKSPRYLYVAAVVLAIAAGFRPQTAIFLAPLCLLAASRARPATNLLAGGIAASLSALWLVPLLLLTGGLAHYLEMTSAYSRAFGYWAPVIDLLRGDPGALLVAGAKIVSYTLYGLGLAALPFIAYAVKDWRSLIDLPGSPRGLFFATWLLPALLFYLFVHMGQQGLVFVYLPALMLLSAAAATRLWAGRRAGRFPVLALVVALVVALNSAIFLAAPEQLHWPVVQKLLTWDTIKNRDDHYQSLVAAIRGRLAPRETVLASANWRHVSYYLPEYRVFRLPTLNVDGERVPSMGDDDADLVLSARLHSQTAAPAALVVVLIDRNPAHVSQVLAARLKRPSAPLPYTLTLGPDEALIWRGGELRLASPAGQ
ncbi:MAG: glycosyltransferase family 39 protein [Chloroflexota bacterium]